MLEQGVITLVLNSMVFKDLSRYCGPTPTMLCKYADVIRSWYIREELLRAGLVYVIE